MAASQTPRKAVTILLVEDNPADVRLVQEALREAQVPNTLIVVGDGEEALAYLRGRTGGGSRPDLIFLDLNLPRLDGWEVLREIKSDPSLRPTPVVVLTTSSDSEDVRRTYDLHANCFITKPVELDRFIEVVQSIESFWLNVAHLPRQSDC